MLAMLLPPLLLGCAAPDAGAARAPDPEETGTPPLDYRDVAPQWTAEEALAHAAEILAYGWPDPLEPMAAFNLLMSFGDATCPGNDLAYIDTLNGCSAESGYWYMGLGKFTFAVTRQDGESGDAWLTELRTVNGDFEIRTPDGRELTAGGGLDLTRTTTASGGAAMASVRGSWRWSGSEHAWLATGVSADLRTYAQVGADAGDAEVGDSVVIDGVYGIDHHYARFEGMTFAGDCGWGAQGGTIVLRQDDQTSTTLAFAEDCSGCATVSWEGEPLGEACADWSAYGADVATTTLGGL